MRIAILTAGVLGLAVSACAPTPAMDTPEGQARQCIFASQIHSFSSQGRESIIVHAGRAAYELTTVGYCADVDWAQQVGVDTLGGSSLCVGDQADLIVRSLGGRPDRCRVRVSRALTEAEIEAL
ncbi:MAG: DUF6491 family protein [Brevundimonas sp.]|uniref:DUF6491 family protein n=1 Tax=Brevundimonas sp. TaxID=1871086 RepID=UPI00391D6505